MAKLVEDRVVELFSPSKAEQGQWRKTIDYARRHGLFPEGHSIACTITRNGTMFIWLVTSTRPHPSRKESADLSSIPMPAGLEHTHPVVAALRKPRAAHLARGTPAPEPVDPDRHRQRGNRPRVGGRRMPAPPACPSDSSAESSRTTGRGNPDRHRRLLLPCHHRPSASQSDRPGQGQPPRGHIAPRLGPVPNRGGPTARTSHSSSASFGLLPIYGIGVADFARMGERTRVIVSPTHNLGKT